MCDASEGLTAEDLRVADMAMEKHCATVIALNKWDVTRTDLEDAKARITRKLRQRPPVLAVSAATAGAASSVWWPPPSSGPTAPRS